MRGFLILVCFSLLFASSEMSYKFDYNDGEDIEAKILALLSVEAQSHEELYQFAKIYYSIGDLDNSNASILKAIEGKPDEERYREYQESLEGLKNGIKSAQKTYEVSGELDETVSDYEKLALSFPDSPLPYFNLGLIYLKSGDYESAVVNFIAARDRNPYDTEKYNNSILSISKRLAKSGDQQYKIGEYKEALSLYLESVEYSPSFSAALYRITSVYQKLNEYELAAEFAKKTLSYDLDHYKAMKSLGDIYSKLGQDEESMQYYRQSIDVNPKYYKAYYSLAKLLKERGDIDVAVSNLDQAIMINDKYDKSYTLLGVIYLEQSNYDQAIYNFNKAMAINNKSYILHFRLSEAYNKSGQYEQAKKAAKDSLSRKRNYGGAFFELGYAELHLCNKIAAQDSFEKAKKDKTYRKAANYQLENLDYLLNEACK